MEVFVAPPTLLVRVGVSTWVWSCMSAHVFMCVTVQCVCVCVCVYIWSFLAGDMDPKPSALGGVDCRTGIGGVARELLSPGPPIWCTVEVLQPAHHSGASTNT